MFDLDAALDRWVLDTVDDEPGLAQHAEEIADHLRSVALARIEDGDDPADAFAVALLALGKPSDLADEFRKSGNLVSRLRSFSEGDCTRRRRDWQLVSGMWVVLSLAWAAAMFVVEDSSQWMILGWTLTTYLPLSLFSLKWGRTARP